MYITAYWGNHDVSATIRVSKATWESILSGAEYEAWASYEYEGEKFDSYWRFSKKTLSISADGGRECLIDEPLSELILVEEVRGPRKKRGFE